MAAPPPSPPSPATSLPLQSPVTFSAPSARFPFATPHLTVKTEPPTSTNPNENTPTAAVAAVSAVAVAVPSHSRWFSFGEICVTEIKMLPEFFDGKSAKNPNLYKYYRDSIVRRFREHPSRKISFTEVRRTLVGDVGSIRRVFDFLETWGLINYTGSERPISKDSKPSVDEKDKQRIENPKSFCSCCKSECNIVCFATEKVPDFILCARCFVRGSFKGGLTHADFKRIDVSGISEEKKREWSDKDVLHLLEALLLHGDDWKKVAEHVGSGKSEKDCIMRFIRLPFAEQFMDQRHQDDDKTMKTLSLSPLADASNPIMCQVAFLAALAGSDIVEAASKAAIGALVEGNLDNSQIGNIRNSGAVEGDQGKDGIFPSSDKQESNDQSSAFSEARLLLEREEREVEESLFKIVGTQVWSKPSCRNFLSVKWKCTAPMQMKGMLEKIIHFEDLELLLEREWLQLQHLRNLLFADQLNFLQQRSKSNVEDGGEKMDIETLGNE